MVLRLEIHSKMFTYSIGRNYIDNNVSTPAAKQTKYITVAYSISSTAILSLAYTIRFRHYFDEHMLSLKFKFYGENYSAKQFK